MQVTLIDGSELDLTSLDVRQLGQLHWQQERAFARRILQSPRGSDARRRAFREGYDTVTRILAVRSRTDQDGVVMGMNQRYVKLVRALLRRAPMANDRPPRVFEVGYGSGVMLDGLARTGIQVGGIEVSGYMRDLARQRLATEHHEGLLLGDFMTADLSSWHGCQAVYWNDVLEHLPPDEAMDYVARIHALLAPGGVLVSITPNWHMRPMDVTCAHRPPRSTAEGFHLKEYTLREVVSLLREGGFQRVTMPLFVTPRYSCLGAGGLCGAKRALEPLLETLPFRLAALLCRGFALNTTFAWKSPHTG